MKLEAEELEKDLKNNDKDVEACNETIQGYQEQIDQLQQAAAESKVQTNGHQHNFNKDAFCFNTILLFMVVSWFTTLCL